jgi:D-threo-aldose 1-dehydrogenase
LGKNGLAVPILGLGTAPLSGLYRHVEEAEASAVIHAALDQGVTLFDTAPLYGRGLSERYLGAALAGVPRERYLISTKVGRLFDDPHGSIVFDFSRDGVLRSLEGSLQRLHTDRVDILHIHDPDNHQEEALEEAFPTLEELRRQGVVAAIGAGMNQWEALLHFAHFADFDCFLLAGRYTLLEQGALPFLDACQAKGIGVLLGGVFNSGILATGAVPGAKHNYRDAPPDILHRTQAIQDICARHGVPLAAAALQFCCAHPAVASLVVGAVTPGEVQANAAGLQAPIPARLWEDLRVEGLVDAHAPAPRPVLEES